MSKVLNKICLVSPLPPPLGGMAIQATKLATLLEEADYRVELVRTNTDFPKLLVWAKKIPVLRTWLNSLLFLVRLRGAAKSSDVVYFLSGFINFFFWISYPAIILCKLSGIPVVLSARGGGARVFFARWKLIIEPIVKRIDLITTPSGFLQQAFVDAFDIKPEIVPNIADLEQFPFRLREKLQPKLIVSRSLEDIYNVACVIRAFKIVLELYPDATLDIVGDGSLRGQLEALVKQLGVTAAVTFHGRVQHEQIQQLYENNDISINASNVDNLPGTVLEAFACGLPVVSTNAGGIPYLVEDGKTGLLVDCNDCAALARRVCDLLEQPLLARQLSENGRKECDHYTAERVRELLLPLLDRVVSGWIS